MDIMQQFSMNAVDGAVHHDAVDGGVDGSADGATDDIDGGPKWSTV